MLIIEAGFGHVKGVDFVVVYKEKNGNVKVPSG